MQETIILSTVSESLTLLELNPKSKERVELPTRSFDSYINE
jgi:hypothetical protein